MPRIDSFCYRRTSVRARSDQSEEPRRDTTMEAVEEMKHEDQALDRQIHSICRGC
jgi:hypothetical protein